MKTTKKTGYPALILYMLGFLLGTLLPNLLWQQKYHKQTLTAIYLLTVFTTDTIPTPGYLLEILQRRGIPYLFFTCSALTIFGVPFAITGTLLFGIATGALLAMSVLEFGLSGGLIGLALLLPQYIIYIPTTLFLMAQVYEQSLTIWKNKTLFPKNIGSFLLKALLCAALYTVGILLEYHINPWLTEKVLDLVKIF